jgi:2-C-methyl-D-erythritol 4-phosphate cytidylyltransferase/2-C-methyl-D-erythritol 2,4-cyclodiphosphate synthase
MVGLIIPAAGQGTRFGSKQNKIFTLINGRTALDWTLSAFQSHPQIDCIVLVSSSADMDEMQSFARNYSKIIKCVQGGQCRQESVLNGLRALPNDCDIVLIHDAARPATDHKVISDVLEAIKRFGAAAPGLPVLDTVKRVSGDDHMICETVDRTNLWSVQTPQGAYLSILLNAYEKIEGQFSAFTDEASILETAGVPVSIVMGNENNIKLTVPEDAERLKGILSPQKPQNQSFSVVRTGLGYDVHPFISGRPLWLGGVNIPHPLGLKGHSDADAALHALCDALLGAAALGDIGILFPDTDAAHKDRASIEFVQETSKLLKTNGWVIQNVDLTILAEQPKISPHRLQMIQHISAALEIAPSCVNIKATTSEKLGFAGRGEGIACWAVATIQR